MITTGRVAVDLRLAAKQSTVAIIGGGPTGCLMAIQLARRGYEVEVFELRGDPRASCSGTHRAINLTLAARGLSALADVGLVEPVLASSVPLKGRMVHGDGTELTFHPYGTQSNELLYSVRRSELNATLLEAAASYPNVRISFNTRCMRVDRDSGQVLLYDQIADRELSLCADHIVGTDGVFSTVRQHMQRGLGAEYRQESLDWGYKELVIPAGSLGVSLLATDVLHVWPRADLLLLAIPNADGSFVCTCVLPFHGPDSLESLRTAQEVLAFMRATFGDAVASIPGIADQFMCNPTSTFTTTRTSPWHYKGQVVLLGDACHAVYPFYGQGLNAALEDCLIWNRCLDSHRGDWGEACAAYEALRKPGTDMLAELSEQNFIELRDKANSCVLAARKRVTLALARCVPAVWIPLYTMVSHTDMPYDAAVRRARMQERIGRWLGLDILVVLVAAWSAFERRQSRRSASRHQKRRSTKPVNGGLEKPLEKLVVFSEKGVKGNE